MQRRRLIRLIVCVAMLAAVIIGVILPMGIGANFIAALLLGNVCGPAGPMPSEMGLTAQEIRIPLANGVARGWFMSGRLPEIILSPTATGSRYGSLPDLAPLVRAGFGGVTWDGPRCLDKPLTIGLQESEDIGAVLDYLARNPDNLPILPGTKYALYGFSAAGVASTLAAARRPDVAALLTAGGFERWDSVTGLSQGSTYFEWMIGLGGQLTYRAITGRDPHALDPLAAIVNVPPRPILLMYGSLERSLYGAQAQLAAIHAKDPQARVALYVVPNADHGGYLNIVGESEYTARLLPFFRCALINEACEAWAAQVSASR